MAPHRLVVIDDHALFRQGIVRLLQDHEQWEVVGEWGLDTDVVDQIGMLSPDVVLLDVSSPDARALRLLSQIARAMPDVDVVVLVASDDDDRALEALRAGAKGCVPKTTEFRVLVKSLSAVMAGEVAVSRVLTRRLLESMSSQHWSNGNHLPSPNISVREREVLCLLAGGASNDEIAGALCITRNTVRSHVRTILRKLELHNRVQAAAYAVREGLVPDGMEDAGI